MKGVGFGKQEDNRKPAGNCETDMSFMNLRVGMAAMKPCVRNSGRIKREFV
jgi:hypothetical protein